MTPGRFIVIDGPDGAGKSTLATRLSAAIRGVREGAETCDGADAAACPGDCEGDCSCPKIGTLTFATTPGADGDAGTEELAIAMAHDRHVHLRSVIEPALANGYDVVCDRYVLSTIVYQGEALRRGYRSNLAAVLDFLVAGVREPDLTIVLDIETEVARARQAAKRRDRFEDDPGLQARVRARYLELALERRLPVLAGLLSVDQLVEQAIALLRR